jgi:hypothetical protein
VLEKVIPTIVPRDMARQTVRRHQREEKSA